MGTAVCSLAMKLWHKAGGEEPTSTPEGSKPPSRTAAPACNLRGVFVYHQEVLEGFWECRAGSPTLAGGVDPTVPSPPVSQAFNGPFSPQNNGVSSGAHSPRVTYSSFEATVELLRVL